MNSKTLKQSIVISNIVIKKIRYIYIYPYRNCFNILTPLGELDLNLVKLFAEKSDEKPRKNLKIGALVW